MFWCVDWYGHVNKLVFLKGMGIIWVAVHCGCCSYKLIHLEPGVFCALKYKCNYIGLRVRPSTILGRLIDCVCYKWYNLSPHVVDLSHVRDGKHNYICTSLIFQAVVFDFV